MRGKDRHQVWEFGLSYSAAKTRKAQLEMEEANNTHIDQNNITVSEFLHEFLKKYGEKKWVASTYDGNVGLLENYVYPYLGDQKLRSIRVKTVDDYYHFLRFSVKSCVSEIRQSQDYGRENRALSWLDSLPPPLPCGRGGMRAACGVNAVPAAGGS